MCRTLIETSQVYAMWSIQQLQYRCYFIIFKLLGLFPISRIHFLLKFSMFFFQVMVLKWHLLLARYFLNWPLMRKWHITYYLSDCQGFQPSKKLNLPYKTMKLCYSIHTELNGTYFPSSKNIICYSKSLLEVTAIYIHAGFREFKKLRRQLLRKCHI